MAKTRIVAVTGTRADYNPLYWTLRRLKEDRRFDLRLVVTGTHLDRRAGSTWRRIIEDGFPIHRRVPILGSGDDALEMARVIGRGVSRLAAALRDLKPDVVLLLGDQYTALATASACLPLRIPVAHVHGGESTLGLIDDQIRHAVTKLSHLHFVSTDLYARRIRSMGEDPWRIKVVGATGLESLRKLKLLSPEELAHRFRLDWTRPVYLFTFYPGTLEPERLGRDLEEVMAAVSSHPGQWVISASNSDTGGRAIWNRIVKIAQKGDARIVQDLGRHVYISLMKQATAMVGNSSSGIIEAPSFGLPVVNIGTRQSGRVRGANVIDVPADRNRIRKALTQASSAAFRKKAEAVRNPYDRGDASKGIMKVLARLPDQKRLIEKPFCDPDLLCRAR